MSRSRRKTPITGNTKKDSDKDFKKQEHGIERAKERVLIKQTLTGNEDAAQELKHEQEPYNDWLSNKDGKQWIGDLKNKKYKDKLMRK